MVQKILFSQKFTFHSYLIVFLFFVFTIHVNAQCAGTDTTMSDVCDITNASSTTINLFNGLGGSPIPGGTWKDDDKSGGLDKITGILNAQQIKKSGTYKYTYTVTGSPGCADNTGQVTITIGGYTGVPGPNSSICNTESAYNLYEAFNGNFLQPQTGGTWIGNTSNLGLANNLLNATQLSYDTTYEYTYSIPAIGSCPAPPDVKVYMSIYRSPLPGVPNDLKLCSNQLSAYTNLDLNTRLTGQDSDGVWAETSTDEIDNNDDNDSFVNIQNIYDINGPGTYTFSYTVPSDNNVCDDQTSFINITIEKLLDYTGATLTVNDPICENDISTTSISATLKDVVNIPDGSYTITYTISGNASPITVTRNFLNNTLTFPIPSSNFSLPGDYTITVINIVSSTTLNICNNIIPLISGVIKIDPIPRINSATLDITDVCQTDDATVLFSGTSNLTDGSYDIFYSLSQNNIAANIASVLNITAGLGSISIPKNLIPNSGITNIAITRITNRLTGCTNTSTLNKDFKVNALPNVTNLAIRIKDICKGQPATVVLTGLGTLTDISINYEISGANTVASQTIPLTLVGGAISFPILATAIPTEGATTLTITNITNTITGCFVTMNNPTAFKVNPLPSIPSINPQSFCSVDNSTVANLPLQGIQYQWFDSATSTVPLIQSAPLVAGDYFVKEVNTITGCESGLQTVPVIINTTPQINNALVMIDPVCQGNNSNVMFAAGTTNLTDGNYDIIYNLTGINVATAVSAILNVTSGIPTFTINSGLIPKAGNTTITITKITNTATDCFNTSTLSKVFVINAIPDISNMIVTVNGGCLQQDLNVDISGLTNSATITLSYTLSGANTIPSQTVSLVVSAGKTSFAIPGSSLSAIGSNTLFITNITNTGNSCSTVINSVSNDFVVNAIPNNPTADNQVFCEGDLATVANLIPNGNQYKWYDSANSTTALSPNTLLVTKNYYVKEVNATTTCQSGATAIIVKINTVSTPTLNPKGEEFCGIDKPTIQNLTDNTNYSENFMWYSAPVNGTAFANSDLLIDTTSYYGIDYNSTTRCSSKPLEVIVSLTECDVTPDGLFIPDGFSPNGDGVNDTFQIKNIEFSFPNYTLEIFNRYGNVLFKGNINKPDWDGKNSNTSFINGDSPTGVYFYIINFNKDNFQPKQGQLYLNR